MKTTRMRRPWHDGVTFVLATLVLTLAGQLSAQPAQPVLEEVIVTGSRIARDANLTGAQPVQSISAEEIRASGEFSISDVVNDIPALLNSVTSEQSIDSALANGSNILSLRGLGSNRTLVLVDGRRHVGGRSGTSAVDVGSIPMPLVERIEVLTGGASAVYGADAVTGVVNFILRDDYEGLEIDANYALSEYGDGGQSAVSAVWGSNFLEGRANLTVAVDLRKDDGLQVTDRSDGLEAGSARDWVNPALRFQRGDIGADTPNFARYYNYGNTGRIQYGLEIPSADDFSSAFSDAFGAMPSLTAAENALIQRAANAPQRAVLPFRTFPFTSGYGYVVPGNPNTFAGFDPLTPVDLDGNGNPDCLDSFTGYNSVFGAESFGAVGGCWNIQADGTYRPVRDGLVAGNFQGFGGDSFNTLQNERGDILIPEEKATININGNIELNDSATLFGEFKYVTQETETDSRPTSFWDLLQGDPDNPFLPDFLRDIAAETGGVAITIDPILFDAISRTERDTVRVVGGVEGEFSNGWNYEFSANYGRYHQESTSTGNVINDRFFAAIDAVRNPRTGSPACRADVDPNAPARTTPFNIPAYDPGYFSFTPGAGDCVPLNIWAGQPGVSREAAQWVTIPDWSDFTIDQFVVAAAVTGDTSDWFELPGGPVGFAFGGEYRREESIAKYDAWQRGVIPAGSPFAAGTMLSDVSENSSLTFRPQIPVNNEVGDYDARDGFIEIALPLLVDRPFFQELTLDVAGRFAEYSTVGSTTSWKSNLVWAVVEDVALRGSISQSVRAPNITEYFGPESGTTFRPADPCDAAQINALMEDNPTLANNYRSNCVADLQSFGLDPFDADGNYVFADPLSAAFGGITGGNRNLNEETADTTTYGVIIQPRFLPGFSLTVDYWDIEIEDAIASVSSQDIVDGCYQGAALNNNFCSLFTRNMDPASAQFGGFNFLRTTDINFAKLETSGIDFSASYDFNWNAHDFSVTVSGTSVDNLDLFTNPNDLQEVNPELGEVNNPDLAGNVYLNWEWGDLRVGWQAQYLDEMLLSFVEVETAETLYGDIVLMEETWIHDVNASYLVTDEVTLYGGVRNVTQEDPFATDRAFPATPRGRMIFLGGTYRLQ